MRKILLAALLLVSIGAMSQADGRWIKKPGLYSMPKVRLTALDSASTAPGGFLAVGDSGKIYKTAGFTPLQADSLNSRVEISGTGEIMHVLGDSYMSGQGASPSSYNMAHILAGRFGKTLDSSMAVGGTGGVQAVISSNRFLASYNANEMIWANIGLNDLRRGGSGYRTFRKLRNNIETLLTNHFLGFGVATSSSTVTKGGTWTAQDISGLGAKAGNGIMTGTSMYAQSSGATMTWITPVATNSITWGEYVIDSVLATGGTYTISIDGVNQINPETGTTTWSQNAQTDGISDGFQANQQMPNSHTIFTPDFKIHTVVLTTTNASTVYVDYFGYLRPFNEAAPIFIDKIPKMTAFGYAATPANSSIAISNSGDSIILVTAAKFLAKNYPASIVNVNSYFSPVAAYLDADSIHPNNAGHAKFADAILDRVTFKGKTSFPIINKLVNIPFTNAANVKLGNILNVDVARDYAGMGSYNVFGYPYFFLNNPGASTNNKLSDMYVDNSGILHWRFISDNQLSATAIMDFYHTGATSMDSIKTDGALFIGKEFKSQYVDLLGANPTAANDKVISMGRFAFGLPYPFIDFYNTGAAANNGKWEMYADGTDFNFRVLNDAKSADGPIFNVNRTGTTVNYFKHSTPVLMPASGYLNFGGTTAGASGYGVRDNAGTIEIKNSGGSWAAPGGGSMTNPLTTTGDIIYSSSGTTPARLGIGSTNQVLTVIGGLPSWQTAASGPSTRIYGGTQITGTNANVTAAAGTVLYLPAATLSANRTIDMTALNTDLDFIRINNAEAGFTWSFTGQSVYLYDRTTVLTNLSPNTNYEIIRVSGKLVIQN